MNRLLLRQLRHLDAGEDAPPAKWAEFLRSVSDAYDAAEQDRLRIERSMELMSGELTTRNAVLSRDVRALASAEAALRESEARLRQEMADRERVEVELRFKQKLEAVGQLAAGIAHEINTPVQYIGDSVHFLNESVQGLTRLLDQCREWLRSLPSSPESDAARAALDAAEADADLEYLHEHVPKAFERVFEGVGRVATIVRAVKDFAHPDQRDLAPADLNRAIESTLIVTRNEYKYVADLETDLAPLPPVRCLVGDLSQVFLNLVVNAAHAIIDRNAASTGLRGRIRVRSAVEGTDAVVWVSDTGSGIPAEIRDRIFDPFFTTKEVGRGMGQGLAISRSIVVEKHGGDLTFETVVGEGTTFRVRLPIDGPVPLKAAA